MNQQQAEIEALAAEVEQFMRRKTAERGLSYTALRGKLFASWFGTPSYDDSEIALLVRALHCQQSNDQDGYRAACLAYLKTRHGAQIGDQVNLHGFPKARNVIIEDFHIELDESDLLKKSIAWFVGPCHGNPTLTKHGQPVNEAAVRSQHPRPIA